MTVYLRYHENSAPLCNDPHNWFDGRREGNKLVLDVKHSHCCLFTFLLRYNSEVTTVPRIIIVELQLCFRDLPAQKPFCTLEGIALASALSIVAIHGIRLASGKMSLWHVERSNAEVS